MSSRAAKVVGQVIDAWKTQVRGQEVRKMGLKVPKRERFDRERGQVVFRSLKPRVQDGSKSGQNSLKRSISDGAVLSGQCLNRLD